MFSKKEVEFLMGQFYPNPNYTRFLKHSIHRKLQKFEKEIFPILLQNSYTRDWLMNLVRKFSNTVREFSNTHPKNIQEKTLNNGFPGKTTINNNHFPKLNQNLGVVGDEIPYIWWTGRDLNPRPSDCKSIRTFGSDTSLKEILRDFEDYLVVNQNLKEKTVKDYVSYIKRFLETVGKDPYTIDMKDIQGFLKQTQTAKRHYILAIRLFFGRFLKMKDLVEDFKVPQIPIKPKFLPSKKEIKNAYNQLKNLKQKAIFMLIATSGLRLHEVLELEASDIDLENRIIKPRQFGNQTKRTWVTFFNEEAKQVLQEYIKQYNVKDGRLFSNGKPYNKHVFPRRFKISPKMLREWFCSEMGKLGVPDRYVDAFCGRVPRSVLARHYTDFSPERLKEIYDKAGLKVLS